MLTRRFEILVMTLLAGGVAVANGAMRAAGPSTLPASALAPSAPPVKRNSVGDWPKYCGNLSLDGYSSGENQLTQIGRASCRERV